MTIPFRPPNPPAGNGPTEPALLSRRRGAPKGNQNARKRAFPYDQHEDLWDLFLAAREARGMADEIAMLRVRIKLLYTRQAPLDEVLGALNVLNRLLITHHRLMDPEGDPSYDE